MRQPLSPATAPASSRPAYRRRCEVKFPEKVWQDVVPVTSNRGRHEPRGFEETQEDK